MGQSLLRLEHNLAFQASTKTVYVQGSRGPRCALHAAPGVHLKREEECGSQPYPHLSSLTAKHNPIKGIKNPAAPGPHLQRAGGVRIPALTITCLVRTKKSTVQGISKPCHARGRACSAEEELRVPALALAAAPGAQQRQAHLPAVVQVGVEAHRPAACAPTWQRFSCPMVPLQSSKLPAAFPECARCSGLRGPQYGTACKGYCSA